MRVGSAVVAGLKAERAVGMRAVDMSAVVLYYQQEVDDCCRVRF